MSASPRPAATVALLREGPQGPEVFMVKRSSKSAFMPHAHVFPGGRVDEDDAAAPGDGGASDRARMAVEGARAYQVAAIRETVEEAGVLLGDGQPTDLDREALRAGQTSFVELVRARGWRPDLDALVYWSWWITPEVEPRRFDTRFFVARVERGVAARHDAYETVQSSWWTAAETLRRFDAGEVNLAPPTLCTLLELASFGTVEAVLEAGRLRRPTPIMPRTVVADDGAITVLLPGDPEFPSEEPVAGPTRVTLRQGRWLVHR